MPEPLASAEGKGRRRIFILLLGLLAVVVVGLAAWLAVTGASASRTVEDLLASNQEIDPVEETSALCAEIGCVEGWSTDIGLYLRFGSVGEAEYWATVLGDDGRRFESMVLDMSGIEASFEQKRKAIDVLFAWHDWH